MRSHFQSKSSLRRSAGFTLVEMLAVLSVMAVLWALTVPALTGVLSAQKLTSAAAQISGDIQRSVLFARAQNTYVWLQLRTEEEGVVLSGFFSRDGTDNSADPENVSRPWDTQRLDGVALGMTEGSGNITRPEAEFVFSGGGGWLVISPRGEVRAASGTGEVPPANPEQPMRWTEIPLRELGTADSNANAAIVQVAGLTGQSLTFRP